jgi:hypothetical protein
MMIAVLSLLAALAGNSISVVVKDPSGAVVPGASIIARTTEGDRVAVSGRTGRFVVDPASGAVTSSSRSRGSGRKQQTTEPNVTTITVTLEPSSLREDITVRPRTEQRLADVGRQRAESVDIGSRRVSVDDALAAADVQPVHATGAPSSNPTSQGVALRGIG